MTKNIENSLRGLHCI